MVYNLPQMQKENSQHHLDFWDGHSFGDDCGWENDDWTPLDLIKSIWHKRSKNEEERQAFKELKFFLALHSTQLLKVFATGEVFQMKNLPIGSVVKYSYDWQEPGDFEPEQIENEWAILYQEKDSGDDVLIGFEERAFYDEFDGQLASRIYQERIVIGQVVHTKERSHWRKDQDLTRFNTLEVWHAGTRARVERNRDSIPTFNPALQGF